MTVCMVVGHAPPLPFLPEDVHGKMLVIVPSLWLGTPDEGEKRIKPMREPPRSLFNGIYTCMRWRGYE